MARTHGSQAAAVPQQQAVLQAAAMLSSSLWPYSTEQWELSPDRSNFINLQTDETKMPLFVRLQSPTCKDASSPGDGGEGWNSGLIHCHISKAALGKGSRVQVPAASLQCVPSTHTSSAGILWSERKSEWRLLRYLLKMHKRVSTSWHINQKNSRIKTMKKSLQQAVFSFCSFPFATMRSRMIPTEKSRE